MKVVIIMTNKEIYQRLLECADTEIKEWKKANKLTELEQMGRYIPVVAGIARSALFLLPTDMYFKFKDDITKLGGVI